MVGVGGMNMKFGVYDKERSNKVKEKICNLQKGKKSIFLKIKQSVKRTSILWTKYVNGFHQWTISIIF